MLSVTITADDVMPDGTLIGATITSDQHEWGLDMTVSRDLDGKCVVFGRRVSWTLCRDIRPLLIECGERDTLASLIEWLGNSDEEAAKLRWSDELTLSEREIGEQEYRAKTTDGSHK